MTVKVTTVHDYDRLLDFNYTHALSRKFTWILVIACVVICTAMFVLNATLGMLDYIDYICLFVVIFVTLLLVFTSFILPRFLIKGAYFYGQEETVTFTEENISYTSVNSSGTSSGTITYPTVIHVLRSPKSYLFYIAGSVAYIVDRAGVYEQVSATEFEAFLARVLGENKLKFKRS